MAWGIALKGHRFDLLDWAEAFEQPFDPWVERFERAEPLYVLRSTEFALARSEGDMWDRAEALVGRLNGAMLLSHNAVPLVVDGLVEFDASGAFVRHIRMVVGTARGRSRVRSASAVSSDGQAPAPSTAQRFNALSREGVADARQADDVADLLMCLARSDNWIDLYKAIELVCKIGRGEHAVIRAYGADGKVFKRAKTSANVLRHARFSMNGEPMALRDARAVVIKIARSMLDSL